MSVFEVLLESIKIAYRVEVWEQNLDYERVLFWCRKCHWHDLLFRDFPLNKESAKDLEEVGKDKDGFTQVQGKQRTTMNSVKLVAQEQPKVSI